MFPNQISFKNLFSNKPGQLLRSRSEADFTESQSGSQYYSQADLQDSQEINSQQFSSGNSQNSNSPSRKGRPSYGNKPSRYHDTLSSKTNNQPQRQNNYHQQLQINQARAKERDEKDSLQTLLANVKECTSDIKTNMCVITDCVQKGANDTEQQLFKCLEAIKAGLDKYSEEMLNCLQTKENHLKEVTQLREQLAGKEEQITKLEKEVKRFSEKDENTIVNAIQDSIKDHETKTVDHIKKQNQQHKKELQHHAKDQERVYIDLLNHTQTWQQQMLQDHQQSVKQLGDRLGDDLEEQQKQRDAGEAKLKEEIEHQVQDVLRKQGKEVGRLLDQQLKELKNDGDDKYAELVDQQQQNLMEIQNKQKRDFEKYIQQQVHVTVSHTEDQLGQMINTLWENQCQQMQSRQEKQQQQFKNQLNEKYDQELLALRTRHEQEVTRLTAEREAREARKQQVEAERETKEASSSRFSQLVFSPYINGPPSIRSPGTTLSASKIFTLPASHGMFSKSPAIRPSPRVVAEEAKMTYSKSPGKNRYPSREESQKQQQETQGLLQSQSRYESNLKSGNIFSLGRSSSELSPNDLLSPRMPIFKDMWNSRNPITMCASSPSQVAKVLPQTRAALPIRDSSASRHERPRTRAALPVTYTRDRDPSPEEIPQTRSSFTRSAVETQRASPMTTTRRRSARNQDSSSNGHSMDNDDEEQEETVEEEETANNKNKKRRKMKKKGNNWGGKKWKKTQQEVITPDELMIQNDEIGPDIRADQNMINQTLYKPKNKRKMKNPRSNSVSSQPEENQENRNPDPETLYGVGEPQNKRKQNVSKSVDSMRQCVEVQESAVFKRSSKAKQDEPRYQQRVSRPAKEPAVYQSSKATGRPLLDDSSFSESGYELLEPMKKKPNTSKLDEPKKSVQANTIALGLFHRDSRPSQSSRDIYDFEDADTDSRFTCQYTRRAFSETATSSCTTEESRWQAALKIPASRHSQTGLGKHSQNYRKFIESARQCLSPVLTGEVFSQNTDGGSSGESSPAMSVMEVVIRRKVKQDKNMDSQESENAEEEDPVYKALPSSEPEKESKKKKKAPAKRKTRAKNAV